MRVAFRGSPGSNDARIRFLDQMGYDLGIGLAAERMATGLELLAQLGVVLDDAVVHDCDIARARRMWVRVGLRRPSVRRPTRVADAARAQKVEMRGSVRKLCNLATPPDDCESVGFNDGDSS